MKTQMIVNRVDDWFYIEDLELDICILSMNILIKLSTRKCAGYSYDRVKLAMIVLKRKSAEAITAVDKALVILFSRNLIVFERTQKNEAKKILITDLGIKAVEQYKELMENVD